MAKLQHQLQHSRLLKLPEMLYASSELMALQQARLVHINRRLLQDMGIEQQDFCSAETIADLGRDLKTPVISTLYAGHQFGIYTSRLGDGRVHILGDVPHRDGSLWEVQLKGAGATVFARGNHGRMTLAEAITEYLGAEAMAGLGIASSRGMGLIHHQTPLPQELAIEAQAIFIRTAPSHLRFGHFEYLHNQGEHQTLKQLCDELIDEFYPGLLRFPESDRYLMFLFHVCRQTAELIAQWQAVGFTHAVMNTDNMSILGLSMDFGVYGFMEQYDSEFCPNPNDEQQRYAFDQQVEVGRWNVLALAEALTHLLPQHKIPASLLRHYNQSYRQHWLMLMRGKLGLVQPHDNDQRLINNLLQLLQQYRIDYSRFFRRLSLHQLHELYGLVDDTEERKNWIKDLFIWWSAYEQRFRNEAQDHNSRLTSMRLCNPKYILRQEHLQQVIHAAEIEHNFIPLHELLVVLQSPYAEHGLYQHLS